jgi:hypothetical protein
VLEVSSVLDFQSEITLFAIELDNSLQNVRWIRVTGLDITGATAGFDLVNVSAAQLQPLNGEAPEPASLVLWIFGGLATAFAYGRRKIGRDQGESELLPATSMDNSLLDRQIS